MIETTNDGPRLVSTTYWSTEHARRGLLYLSVNAGAVRLLVPDAASYVLDELPEEGTPATLGRGRWQGREVYRLTWLDDPTDPYVVEIDARQADRLLPASEAGRLVPLVWYRQEGQRGAQEVRRETVEVVP